MSGMMMIMSVLDWMCLDVHYKVYMYSYHNLLHCHFVRLV